MSSFEGSCEGDIDVVVDRRQHPVVAIVVDGSDVDNATWV